MYNFFSQKRDYQQLQLMLQHPLQQLTPQHPPLPMLLLHLNNNKLLIYSPKPKVILMLLKTLQI